MATTEQQEVYVSIWAKAVDTQMHFNEMAVKSRQFGLAFVAAALGLGIVLIARGEDFGIPIPGFAGWQLNVSVLIALAGIVALYGVRVLDLNVYHKMLRGAVKFGEDFEENYMKQIFSLQKGMTQAITFFSQYPNAKAEPDGNGKYSYKKGERNEGEKLKTALDKIKRFYNVLMLALFGLAVVLFVARNFSPHEKATDLKPKTESSVELKHATEKSVDPKSPTVNIVDPNPATEKAGTSAK
jgi:H+/Cl- antiporter ClcA